MMQFDYENEIGAETAPRLPARAVNVATRAANPGEPVRRRPRLPGLRCRLLPLAMFTVLASLVGCTGGSETTTDGGVEVNNAAYLLPEDPGDAKDVIAVRDAAEDGDDVLVVGRVGGGENPWIEGRAAFSIVDASLKACSDIPGDNCPKPWDYCCETDKLPTATALVTVVDDDGTLVRKDARDLLNIKELSTVVVKGKAKRDDQGNLTIKASGVYVREL